MPAKRTELPYLPFEQSIAVVEQLYSRAGGSLSKDDFGSIIGNSVKSSSFTRKLNALKNFGLASGSGHTVELTALGVSIAAPESNAQLAEALASSFLRIDLFRKVY